MKHILPLILILSLLLGALPALAEGPFCEIPGLSYESTMPLRVAHEFQVDYFAGGYKLITVSRDARYLVVPEGGAAPAGLDADIRVLQQPLTEIYLAATSAMALFDAVDSLDVIKLSALNANGWYIDNAVAAMESGDMLFAGKYSEPDYEMLIQHGCQLAIESTMILHSPKVQEMIELLGIPVFIDRSSYESHPLGRTEWVKLYAALLNKEAEAEAFFDDQARVIDEMADFPNTGKTVAFFFMSSDGGVVVRNSSDYLARMIEIAGGRYVFGDSLPAESARSSVSLSMEQFYDAAVNADYLIYNGSIDDPLTSIDDLLGRSPLFADFRAVQEGRVWTTDRYLYQATDIIGSLIYDLNHMLLEDGSELVFLKHID